MVISLYPGQAAEEVEKQVTIPIERALTGVPRVLVQRSITSFGLSQVIRTFEDDVDIYFDRQQVAERLPDAEAPGAGPRRGPRAAPSRTSAPTTPRSGRSTSTPARATATRRASCAAG